MFGRKNKFKEGQDLVVQLTIKFAVLTTFDRPQDEILRDAEAIVAQRTRLLQENLRDYAGLAMVEGGGVSVTTTPGEVVPSPRRPQMAIDVPGASLPEVGVLFQGAPEFASKEEERAWMGQRLQAWQEAQAGLGVRRVGPISLTPGEGE